MSPQVIQVEPIAPFKLRLWFNNGDQLVEGIFAAVTQQQLQIHAMTAQQFPLLLCNLQRDIS